MFSAVVMALFLGVPAEPQPVKPDVANLAIVVSREARLYQDGKAVGTFQEPFCKIMEVKDEYVQIQSPLGAVALAKRSDLVSLNLATDYFGKRISENPADHEAFFLRGFSQYKLSNLMAALSDVNEAIRLDPKQHIYVQLRGEVQSGRGELDEAMRDYDKAIQLAPHYPAAYIGRGTIWGKRQAFDKSVKELTEAIRLDPKSGPAYLNRGMAWQFLNEYERAVADYSQALSLHPNFADAFFWRGVAYQCNGEFSKAFNDYSEAIRVNPQYADALYARAIFLLTKNELEKAAADLTEAIRIAPNNVQYLIGRGHVWFEMGVFRNAESDWESALRHDGKCQEARINLAMMWTDCPDLQHYNPKRAIEYATVVKDATNEKDSKSLFVLAAALAETSNFADAIKWGEKAVSIESSADQREFYRRCVEQFRANKKVDYDLHPGSNRDKK